MHLVPETRIGKIEFYQTHLTFWAQDPPSIGLTSDAVDELQTLVDEARQAYQSALAALQTLPPTRRFVPAMQELEKRIKRELENPGGPARADGAKERVGASAARRKLPKRRPIFFVTTAPYWQ